MYIFQCVYLKTLHLVNKTVTCNKDTNREAFGLQNLLKQVIFQIMHLHKTVFLL